MERKVRAARRIVAQQRMQIIHSRNDSELCTPQVLHTAKTELQHIEKFVVYSGKRY